MDNNYYLYKDKDGNIQRATAGGAVDRKEVERKVAAAKTELALWTGVLTQYDALAGTATKNQPALGKEALVGVDDGDGHVTFNKEPLI